jgi:F-type H+-transporting ATPase subunit b
MFDLFTLTVLAASEAKPDGGFLGAFKLETPSLFFYTFCFLLVAFVLHRFLFKPLIAILDQRDKDLQNIQLEQKELQDKLSNASEEAVKIIHEAKTEARQIIENAKQSVGPEAQKIIKIAQVEAQKIIEIASKQAEEVKVSILSTAKAQSFDIVSQILAKAMSQFEINKQEQERILGQIIHKL